MGPDLCLSSSQGETQQDKVSGKDGSTQNSKVFGETYSGMLGGLESPRG